MGETKYLKKRTNPSTGYSLIMNPRSLANIKYNIYSNFMTYEELEKADPLYVDMSSEDKNAPEFDNSLLGVGGIRMYSVRGNDIGVGSFHVAYARENAFDWDTFEGLEIFFGIVVNRKKVIA